MAKEGYDNSNRGALWVNEDRREGKQDPQFRGNFTLTVPVDEVLDNEDGTVTIHRFISAWESHSDRCGDYFSLAVGKKCKKTHGE